MPSAKHSPLAKRKAGPDAKNSAAPFLALGPAEHCRESQENMRVLNWMKNEGTSPHPRPEPDFDTESYRCEQGAGWTHARNMVTPKWGGTGAPPRSFALRAVIPYQSLPSRSPLAGVQAANHVVPLIAPFTK